MRPIFSTAADVVAFSRQAIATGVMCGGFVAITLLSFAAALIDRVRAADPSGDPVE